MDTHLFVYLLHSNTVLCKMKISSNDCFKFHFYFYFFFFHPDAYFFYHFLMFFSLIFTPFFAPSFYYSLVTYFRYSTDNNDCDENGGGFWCIAFILLQFSLVLSTIIYKIMPILSRNSFSKIRWHWRCFDAHKKLIHSRIDKSNIYHHNIFNHIFGDDEV